MGIARRPQALGLLAMLGACGGAGSFDFPGPDASSGLDAAADACPLCATCESSLTPCGAACVDTTSDPANCGGCGVACANALVCDVGHCASACSGPRSLCGSACVDVQTDPAHCGACDAACPGAASICKNSACACPPGHSTCAGQCVDTQIDSQNCGSCGVVCSQVCRAGRCASG